MSLFKAFKEVAVLYVGHFSFDELDSREHVRHGYFSCVVDADTVEKAVTEFRKCVLNQKETDDIFTGILKVYIEEIIQIQRLPQKAIITRLQTSAGEFPKSISYSLPSVDDPGIEAFEWAPETAQDDETSEDYEESIPFIEF